MLVGICGSQSITELGPKAASRSLHREEFVPVMTMQGHEENGRVILKDVLGSIAVVDIPVQDEDAGCACSLGRFGSNASIVEEAEAHGSAALSMMAGRPDNGSTICSFTPANNHQATEWLPGVGNKACVGCFSELLMAVLGRVQTHKECLLCSGIASHALIEVQFDEGAWDRDRKPYITAMAFTLRS